VPGASQATLAALPVVLRRPGGAAYPSSTVSRRTFRPHRRGSRRPYLFLDANARDLGAGPPDSQKPDPPAPDHEPMPWWVKEQLGIPDAQTFEEYKARQGGFPPAGALRDV
jgi:hypothetical protein